MSLSTSPPANVIATFKSCVLISARVLSLYVTFSPSSALSKVNKLVFIFSSRSALVTAIAGTPFGMEAKLIPLAGYDFEPIRVRGFQRKFSINKYSFSIIDF